MFSFACGSIHQGLDPGRFSDESRGRREIYRCLQLGALFVDSRINGGAKISIKYYTPSWKIIAFSLCI